ncbi:MAG: hypothetical protein CL762_01680 [Chloroflexi bacterium]|nr:hypothetical protein [Chloroflexota bacterium]
MVLIWQIEEVILINKSKSKKYDVVIIGGGISGITSMVTLANKGLKTLLLEKSAFLGGRAFSFKDQSTGELIDNGQHVIVGACNEFIKLIKDIDSENKIIKVNNFQVPVIYDGKKSYLGSKYFKSIIGLFISLVNYKHLSFIDKYHLIIALLKIKFTDIDNINIKEENFGVWLNNNNQSSKSIKCFWELIIKPALNDNLEVIETKEALSVIKRSFFGEGDLYLGIPSTNLSSLWSSTENVLQNNSSKILKKTNAERLISSKGKLSSVKLSNGEIIEANNFIISTSQSAAIKLLNDSNINTINNTEEGLLESSPIVGIHFWFKKPVISERYIASAGSNIQWIFNVSRNHNKEDNHIVISQSAAWDWINKDKTYIKDLFLKELILLFPQLKINDLEKYCIVKQPNATFRCINDSSKKRNLETSLSNLFFAGDWTNTSWPSTMESAVISGRKAAELIID